MNRLQRLVTLALHLSARRRVLAKQIAGEFDVSIRTVYRDVKALEAAGFPIVGTAGDGYRIAQDAFLRPLPLAPDEAEALVLVGKALEPTLDATLRGALLRALTKLESTFGAPVRQRVRGVLGQTVFRRGAERQPALTGAILEAVRERRVLRITYRDPRDEVRSRRAIEPLGLVCLGEAWWLVAYCRLREGARIFRVDRIASCDRAGQRFDPRDGFSFAEVIERDRELGRALFGC